MITSLTIRNRTTSGIYITSGTLQGQVTLTGGCYTSVAVDSQTVTTSVDYSHNTGNTDQTPIVLMSLWEDIKALPRFPYLTALVAPGASKNFTTNMRAGDAWILNGNLTMVTPDESDSNTLIYTDLGERALSDEDFQDLQDCCRILRSWLDMAKDNMLTTDNTKWNPAPYQPNRPNCCHCNHIGCSNDLTKDCPDCTIASQKALALYLQYKAVVWLWNYLVGATAAQLKVASHPADAAGLVVAVTAGIPKCWTTAPTTGVQPRLKITVQADVTSGQMPNLLFWIRRTLAASSPSCTGLASTPISVAAQKTSSTTATLFITSYVNLKPNSTYQTVSVFEIFPYYREPGSGSADSGDYIEGTQDGYYQSRTNYNYDSQGTTSWSFQASIGYDEGMEADPPLIYLTHTTATPYAASPEPESETE